MVKRGKTLFVCVCVCALCARFSSQRSAHEDHGGLRGRLIRGRHRALRGGRHGQRHGQRPAARSVLHNLKVVEGLREVAARQRRDHKNVEQRVTPDIEFVSQHVPRLAPAKAVQTECKAQHAATKAINKIRATHGGGNVARCAAPAAVNVQACFALCLCA